MLRRISHFPFEQTGEIIGIRIAQFICDIPDGLSSRVKEEASVLYLSRNEIGNGRSAREFLVDFREIESRHIEMRRQLIKVQSFPDFMLHVGMHFI